jgi:glycosyltransferase involved in cell wall biosynthesis
MYNNLMSKYGTQLAVERRSDPHIGLRTLRVAVLIPCYNEAATIGTVIKDFRAALPTAAIYVYDNNSSDDTIKVADQAGALIRREYQQGKGHVVRRMFADIEADVYVLVDGDDTYEASAAGRLVDKLMSDGLDLVTAKRKAISGEAYRFGHQFGNRLLTFLVAKSFGSRVSDMLSGYRILSRRFVKSFPVLTGGFEIETELTAHALELGMPQDEVETVYRERPAGSDSKLSTYRDGAKILLTIVRLLKAERPLAFFSVWFVILFATSTILAWPILITFLDTGLVPRVPTAILSTGIMLLAFLSLASGLILDTVTRGRREFKRLSYLRIPGPDARRFGE